MIRVNCYFKNNHLYRFRVEGHADFASHGSDIVCAGVSTLVINTINSIEKFLDEEIMLDDVDKKQGVIDCYFANIEKGIYNNQTTILLKSMVFGLQSMEQMYGEYIMIHEINT